MLGTWLVAVGLASPCDALPPLEPLAPPDAWPSYPGRCLDVGPAEETLLQRVRRCVVEEPEDPDVAEVLSWLAEEDDATLLGRMIAGGLHGDVPVRGLARLDASGSALARSELLRAACEGPGQRRAMGALSTRATEEELPVYVPFLGHFPEAMSAVGAVGSAESRALVLADVRPHEQLLGLAMDRSPAGVEAYLAFLDDPDLHPEVVRSLPPHHPATDEVLARTLHTATSQTMHLWLRATSWLDEAATYLVLAAALRHWDEGVRGSAVRRVAIEPEAFPLFAEGLRDLPDPETVAYHVARLQSATVGEVGARRAEVDMLLADRETHWVGVAVALRDPNRSPEERAALYDEATDGDAPEFVASSVPRSLPRRQEVAPWTGPTPSFSRHRVPVADADSWAVEARATLADEQATDDERDRAVAVLPWVGDDRDIERLTHHHAARRALAALGSDAALDVLGDHMTPPVIWGWSRTERGWEEVVASARTSAGVVGVVRPEGYRLAAERLRPGSPRQPDEETSPRGMREGLRRLFRPASAPHRQRVRLELDDLTAEEIGGIIRAPGVRDEVLKQLADLEDPEPALVALVRADWTYRPPPPPVVDAARRMRSPEALQLLASVGELGPLRQALGDPASATTAARVVLSEPLPELLDDLGVAIRQGWVDGLLASRLLDYPGLHDDLRWSVDVPGELPCAMASRAELQALALDDETLLQLLRRCSRSRVPFPMEQERKDRIAAMLREPLHAEELRWVLAMNPGRADAVLAYRGQCDDPEIRQIVLHHLNEAGLTPRTAHMLARWPSDWSYGPEDLTPDDVRARHPDVPSRRYR